jgi:hypothetical protein
MNSKYLSITFATLMILSTFISCGRDEIAESTLADEVESIIAKEYCDSFDAAIDYSEISGDGSANDPYHICTAAQLSSISEDTSSYDKSFELKSNLDLADYFLNGGDAIIIGNSANPFNGTFDGNNFKISNLTLTQSSTSISSRSSNLGLFGVIESGSEVKDLKINCNYSFSAGTRSVIGCLVGTMNAGLVTNVHVDGNISNYDYDAGGLAGDAIGGIISKSSSTVSLTGGGYAGGLIGYQTTPNQVLNSFATGSINSNHNTVGGLIGFASGEIKYSYASGDVNSSGEKIGGLVGDANTAIILDSFASGDVSADSDIDNRLGKLIGLDQSSTLTRIFASNESSITNAGSGAISDHATGTLSLADIQDGLNLPTSNWDRDIWSFSSGKYPQLK